MKGTGEFKNSGSDCGQMVQLVVVGCTRVGKGQSKGKVRKKMYPGAVMQKWKLLLWLKGCAVLALLEENAAGSEQRTERCKEG